MLPRVRRSLRLAVLGAPLVLGATLSACGGDDDVSGPSVLIQPSTFTTQLTQTTAAPAAEGDQAGGNGGTVAGTQVYEVQAGDFLAGIAADYDIPPESIANFNNWDDGLEHSIHPGDTVKIPPGARVPEPDDDEDDDDDEEEADEEDADTTEEDEDEDDNGGPEDEPRCPDGSVQGIYTIEQDDIPSRVADDLDVTLEQLNEANENTPNYSSFIVGTDILVPCGNGSG